MNSSTGQRRPRRFRLRVALLTALGLLAFLVAPAGAVHDIDLFELGPGVATDEGGLTNILGDGNAANGPDWADVFDGSGNVVGLFGGVAASFIQDDTSQKGALDRTTFSGAGGSNKNNDPVSDEDCAARTPPLTGSACDTWHWDSGNVPAKDDLTNLYAYAAFDDAGTPDDPTDDHLILYAGFERLAPEGDSHVDLEFFQTPVALDEDVPCNDPGADETPCEFTGVRTVGDVIVSMDFLQGGALGSVSIREWNGSAYVQIGLLGGEGCNGPDTICAFNNAGPIDGGPWPNYDRHGNTITTLPANSFTEFGADLTSLIGGTPCISTFMGKTRSSQSFTAELKDFGGPSGFNICEFAISIAPDDVNEVGQPHTFTVSVVQEIGALTQPVTVGHVDVTLTDANGAVSEVDPASTCHVNPPDPDPLAGTDNLDAAGQCTVTFTSDTPGTVTAHAEVDIDLFGQTFHAETDATGSNSGDAVKRFVDAFITIGADDVNSIGESHTFTVTVQVNDGTGGGFVDAPDGTIVAVTLTGDADDVTDTCATTGTVGGECTVTFTSDTPGTVTAHASVNLTIDSLTVHRETDSTHGSTGDATKEFVAGSIRWTKEDNAGTLQGGATFEVCRTHNLNTGTGDFVDIDPDACVTVVDDTDGVAGGTLDEDPDPGEFLLSGLRLGRYTVTETVAPPGFAPDPDTETVELTLESPDATISVAFVNRRPIVKITGFGYTNAAAGDPTAGIVSGTTTYTVDLHNYGGASAELTSSSLVVTVAGAGTLTCDGTGTDGRTLVISGNIGSGDNATYTLVCTYDDMADGAVVTADLTIKYTTNGLEREASGSPAGVFFTIQAD